MMIHRSVVGIALAVAVGCGSEPAHDARNSGAAGAGGAGETTGGVSPGAAGVDPVATAGAGSGESVNVAGLLDNNGSVGVAAPGGSGGAAGSSDAGSDGSTDAGSGAGGTACQPPRPGSSGRNPLFSDQYTADPAPMVHDCTFYITCGHDEGNNGFVLREWFLLSSPDLLNWTKSVAMRLNTFAWADANAWAGQMVQKNGRFYWYVPVNQRGSGMAIGVAVADSPEGPFTDAIGAPLVSDASEIAAFNFQNAWQTVYTIDPTVFVDDDGRAYLHYGGFGRLVVARLNADMISIDGPLAEVTPRGFFEAPFLTKQGGRYYEIYAAGVNPATIDYATSTSPLGPWTYGGRILDPLPNVAGQDAATSHPGVAEFAGQWYLVYHLSNGPNNGGTYRREVAVDKLFFNADGSIQRVTPSAGLSF
jgi:hypothetical protein